MSKSEGTKIAIKFTEDLVGGFTPPVSLTEKQDGEWSANGSYSSSYPIGNAKDGSTSTYWQSRSTSNYIQITRPETKMMGVKVYKGSSYRPSGFTLSVSEDGTSFTEVATGTFANSTGWQTVMLDTPIVSNYFRINFGYSSRLYLYELVLVVEEYDNLTSDDFIITGKQQKHINGELVDKRYEVKKYEIHPNFIDSTSDTLLLTIDWWSRFNNVEGKIKVEYDDTKGTLYGVGGAVVSFEREFLPTDLIKNLDPHDTNTFTATANAIIDFINIVYRNRYTTDTFAITANATINFEYVGEINP